MQERNDIGRCWIKRISVLRCWEWSRLKFRFERRLEMKHFIFYFSCMSLLLVSGIVYAHSGGTDANGGHFNHKTGEYHSHDSGGIEFFLVLLGIVILFFVIQLLKESNGKRQVPPQHRSPRSQSTLNLPQRPSTLPVNTLELHSAPVPPIPRVGSQPFDYRAGWWRKISEEYRNDKDWTCEECQLRLDADVDHRYLHVHHIRGTQYNDPEDLKALCIACHSEQPGFHKHLKHSTDYHRFMQKYGQKWKLSTSKRDNVQWVDNTVSHRHPLYPPQSNGAKKPNEVLLSKEKYEFAGKPLTSDIVEKILLRCSEREDFLYFTIREWSEYVRIYHEKRGGLSMQGNLANIVVTSFMSLEKQGRARQKYLRGNSTGVWRVF